jgi:hypothetical protein
VIAGKAYCVINQNVSEEWRPISRTFKVCQHYYPKRFGCQDPILGDTGVMRLKKLELNFQIVLPKFFTERSKIELEKSKRINPVRGW